MVTANKKLEQYNVAMMGHVDHGKTTTSASITVALTSGLKDLSEETCKLLKERNEAKGYYNLDKSAEERERKITMQAAHIQYKTGVRSYSHADCPGHQSFITNMIYNTSGVDAAVLLISVVDGVIPQTLEHLLLAKQLGVKHLAVLINKMDMLTSEQEELIEMNIIEIKDILGQIGWSDPENVRYIPFCATQAIKGEDGEYAKRAIYELLMALDSFPSPTRDIDRSFLIPIAEGIGKSGRGNVATGTIKYGSVQAGDELVLVGYGKEIPVAAKEVQMFRSMVPSACAGDNVGILLKGLGSHSITKEDLMRGKLLAAKNSYASRSKIKVKMRVLPVSEGGRSIPFNAGFEPQFYFMTASITGRIDRIFVEVANEAKVEEVDQEKAIPGQIYNFDITLIKPMAIPMFNEKLELLNITIRGDARTIAIGTVIEYRE